MKNRHSSSARNAGFTLCSAMVAALLAGCAGGPPSVASASQGATSFADAARGMGDDALSKAEAGVLKAPRDSAARAALAQGYLAAGRFVSAAATFEDALALGDRSPRTGLGLALAYVGSGHNAEALDVLNRFAGQLPVGDYGLAIALAGQPAQAVEVLSDAVRNGGSAKTRQNLAYAYALDGRWAEARVIASQDLDGEELDARLQEWSVGATSGTGVQRVAALLGTPVRSDPGQPAALALGGVDHMSSVMMATADADRELPASGAAEQPTDLQTASYAQADTVPAPSVANVPAPTGTSIERAYAAPILPVRSAAAMPKSVRAAKTVADERMTQPRSAGHLVQLGSFSSMEGAKRAWAIFLRRDPSLRSHELRITEAEVNGRRYYRVAAEGFARGQAQSMCSTVKGRGGECFAYEDGRPLPGAVSVRNRPQMAMR